MRQEILSKVRKLNWGLSKELVGNYLFTDLCTTLSDLTDANVYILNKYGKAFGGHYKPNTIRSTNLQTEIGNEKCLDKNNSELLKSKNPMVGLCVNELQDAYMSEIKTENAYHTTIPIVAGKEKLGALFMTRYSSAFSDEDMVLGEFGATIVGLEIQRSINRHNEEETRKDEIVKIALQTLSYSENEAINKVFGKLNGKEGILVASNIADLTKTTRSVIVTALRKLECAGIISCKSVGMKGTHIRVLNNKLLLHLDKRRI